MGVFTEEEIKILSTNIYVKHITCFQIQFSDEFKRIVYEEKCKGKRVREILKEHGIDPELLSRKQIERLSCMVNKLANRATGFKDLRHERIPKPEEQSETTIKQLTHEVAYLRQQVEFLKKLRMADLEAQKQWESKHRRK